MRRPIGPEHAKLQLVRLPFETIGEFLRWLKLRYPSAVLEQIDVSAALYEYYNIDAVRLVEEQAKAGGG